MTEATATADVADVPGREPPPAGIAPELLEEGEGRPDGDGPGLFSLLGGLAALTQEVRLEGRTLKRIEERLSGLAGLDRGPSVAEDLPARIAEARLEGRADMVSDLIDLRDRIARALDAARAAGARRRGLIARLAGDGGAVVEGLVLGTAAVLERLDELLRARDVHEVICAGRPFDPSCMRAVDGGPARGVAPGTVIEVLRVGYRLGERLLRPAEVRVAKGVEG